jgi:hypothetical protein
MASKDVGVEQLRRFRPAVIFDEFLDFPVSPSAKRVCEVFDAEHVAVLRLILTLRDGLARR